ncbi:hypothetical protein WICPIJ_008631 [Wickerhamomyces pijperi]|uniref:BTB domain-containing protein n=1 Tax=Wickerhamomyces pijperi TaxID=599730 RepID=A0A9P8THV2_WICPI|nr:hypothetical protein WICPIJ_008631 [Wickerhamomyces pijperi]
MTITTLPPQSHLPVHKLTKPHKTKGSHPLTRLKSSLSVTSSGKVFLFGGFDEDDVLDGNVYLYDIKTETWECVKSKDLIKDSIEGTQGQSQGDNAVNAVIQGKVFREGHTVLSVPEQDQVIVFGGVSPNDNNNLQLMNQNTSELLVFDLKTKKWHDIISTNCNSGSDNMAINFPSSRSRHAACLSPDGLTMFISGGLDTMNYSLTYDDLYSFDLQTQKWNGPWKFIPRFDHHITVHEGKIWSFGGLSNDMAHVNELISWFDLQTGTTGSVRNDTANDVHHHHHLNGSHLYEVGDHIFVNPSKGDTNVVLDVMVPLISDLNGGGPGLIGNNGNNLHEPFIGLYDIDRLHRCEVFGHNSSNVPSLLSGYSWRHSFCYEGKLYFIGYETMPGTLTEESENESDERRMDCVASLQLSDLGVSEFATGLTTNTNNSRNSSLLMDFKDLLYSGELADFHIVGLDSEDRPATMDAKFVDHNEPINADADTSLDRESFHKSMPIPTHKLILQTRWPYLRTLISSGMVESQDNVLFLQEPITWLKALLEFVYTDKLPQHVVSDMDVLSGLLLLSNLYDLPKLRPVVLREMHNIGFQCDNVVMVWARARCINEELLCHSAKLFIFANWGKVVKEESFLRLSRDELIDLMSEIDSDAMILSNLSSNSAAMNPQQFNKAPLIGYHEPNMMAIPKHSSPTTSSSVHTPSTGNILSNTLDIIRNNMNQDVEDERIEGGNSAWNNIHDSTSTSDLTNSISNTPISLIATTLNNSRRTRIIDDNEQMWDDRTAGSSPISHLEFLRQQRRPY